MSEKLKAADVLAKALRAWMDDPENRDPDAFDIYVALKDYEAIGPEAERRAPVQDPQGVDLIAAERTRQVSKEEWTAYHDDLHDKKELSHAAAAYLSAYWFPGMTGTPGQWPKDWGSEFWKPSPNPIRNLVKAGALIAAEIDRLQRKARAAFARKGGT